MLLDNKETTTQKASPTLLESAGLKWLIINAVVEVCRPKPSYAARESLTAQTLYSGIFETGSSTALVNRLAAA